MQNSASVDAALTPASATRSSLASSPASLWLFWLIADAIALLPLLASSLPPLDQHFYNLVRAEILTHPAAYAEHFSIRWDPIPDLAVDLIVPWLGRFMPLEQACDLFIVASLMLLTSGTVLLSRAVNGRWSVLPLLSFLLLYNWILVRGYENNVFGLGLCLWALAAHVALRRAPLARIVVSSISAVPIYFAHLFPLAEFGLVIGTWELSHLLLEGVSVRRVLVHGAAALVPFIVPVLLLLQSSTGHLGGAFDFAPFAIVRKLKLAIEVFTVGDRLSDLVLLASVALAAAIAFARGWLQCRKQARLTLAVLCVVPLIAPLIAFASYGVTERCALGFAFVILALLEVRGGDYVLKRVVACSLAGVFVFRIMSINEDWQASGKIIQVYRSAFATLKPGSLLMQFKQDTGYPSPLTAPTHWNPPLDKIVALATMNNVLVPTLYLKAGQQPVLYRPRYAPLRAFQIETDGRENPVLADDATLRNWLIRLRQQLSGSDYPFSAVYVAVYDPDHRLDPLLPDARLIATLPGHRLYQLQHVGQASW